VNAAGEGERRREEPENRPWRGVSDAAKCNGRSVELPSQASDAAAVS